MVSVILGQSKEVSELVGEELPPGATFELSQEFYFEAAHTLERDYETVSSRTTHGHTYYGRLTLTGDPTEFSGMVIDLAALRFEVESIKKLLDHKLLNDIEGLGRPTLENICKFVWSKTTFQLTISEIEIWRLPSGDRCKLKLR